jgi:choline dehydrogenase
MAGGKAAAVLADPRRVSRCGRRTRHSRPTISTTGDNEGSGYFEVNQRGGLRWNTTKAFLRPAMKRANLRVLTGAETERLEFDGGAQPASVPLNGRRMLLARAARSFSAGAINSPKILELSGSAGPICCRLPAWTSAHALAGVGENLQDHLQIRTVFRIEGAKDAEPALPQSVQPGGMGLEYALRGPGRCRWRRASSASLPKAIRALATADLEYHVQPLSTDRLGEPLHRYPAVTVSVCNLRPESRGTVHMASVRMLSAAPKSGRTISRPQGTGSSLPIDPPCPQSDGGRCHGENTSRRRCCLGTQYQSDDDLIRRAGDIATTIFHPVGTCKMGDRQFGYMAVVDRSCSAGDHGLAGVARGRRLDHAGRSFRATPTHR